MDGIKHLRSCHFHFKHTHHGYGMLTIERVKLCLKFESVFLLLLFHTSTTTETADDIKHNAFYSYIDETGNFVEWIFIVDTLWLPRYKCMGVGSMAVRWTLSFSDLTTFESYFIVGWKNGLRRCICAQHFFDGQSKTKAICPAVHSHLFYWFDKMCWWNVHYADDGIKHFANPHLQIIESIN